MKETESPTRGESEPPALANDSLRTSEERFRLLVESVKDYAIFMLDPTGRVASWNQGAERIKGYSADEIIGRHFSTFYPRRDVEAGKCERELLTATSEGRFEEEGWRVRKDGSRFWASVTITAVRGPDDRLLGFAKVTRDLTDRVRAELDRVQRIGAEDRERRKDEFLAIMGHELRNPLAPMLTAVHLLRSRNGVGCEKEIQVLDRQVKHMLQLLDDLLDVSRTIRGDLRLSKEIVELHHLVAESAEGASPLIERKNHQLVLDVPEAIFVDVDEKRMTQVFANLLNNAAKYTDPGGHLKVSASATDDMVEVIVEDDGIGMSDELLPLVFDLFTQGKQGLDRKLGGLGVGLAVAKRMLDEHDGSIVAYSDGPGRGSRFTVRLPRATPSERGAYTPRARPVNAPLPRRVLIVDDNRDATEMLAMVLESRGHEVQLAFDAIEALEVVKSFTPAVAILDIGLPGMSGLELVGMLRKLPGLASIPIVAVSGYARASDRKQALDAGFTEHVAKPIDPQQLEAFVELGEPTSSASR